MKWIKVIYDAIWFRCHPVWHAADGSAIYPSWRACWETAKILAS